jgi:hypothetical protein
MQKSSAILDLVEGYSTYTDAQEVQVEANSPAPAASTSVPCAVAVSVAARSSWPCVTAAGGAVVATITTGC